MKKILISVLGSALLLLFSTHSHAISELVPAAPKLKAKSWLLMDYNSGRFLAEKDIDKRVEPASLTKIMTAYVVFYELKNGSIKLEDKVKISEKAWRMKGSRMFVEVNSLVTVEKLLMGLIVQSGNDATIALAEHTAGNEEAFVSLMNKHAANLGLVNTNFVNSTGWPDKNHYTTVRDLALLAKALIRDFQAYYPWFSVKEYTYNIKKAQRNRNLLLWQDERVDGIKTGHTDAAGYCLVASARINGMRLISIVMGASSEHNRAKESRKLLSYGFRFFETFAFHPEDKPVTEVRLWKGESDLLPLGLNETLFVTTPRGMRDKVRTQLDLPEKITAPVVQGKHYGTLNIKLGNKVIASRPLVAMQSIGSGGVWSRFIDNILLLFN
ncbi:MAG: D-alanyl-D-alanine carboxypeptidase [Gammaproteobacteria bacterium]|nr:D-alanyl-D-alanine carboxypeptidase [Gammaproteobacteria bacterium]MDH5652432.1 D-alanyl-D-alanine carboxypeptidase [Gammaproteobacteria bacterium]